MVWDATRALIGALQSHRWPTSEGKVVTSRVTKREADEESLESYSADIEYQYTMNGETKLSGMIGLADINDGRKAKAEALVLRYAEDSLVRVYCSPYDPDVAVLKPGLCWHHFSKLLVCSSSPPESLCCGALVGGVGSPGATEDKVDIHSIHEKTPHFPGNIKEKAGVCFRVIEGARTPDLRNHNPPL